MVDSDYSGTSCNVAQNDQRERCIGRHQAVWLPFAAQRTRMTTARSHLRPDQLYCQRRRYMKCCTVAVALVSMLTLTTGECADPPAPVPAMISGALPYVPVPGAAAAPDKSRVYKVIFDVTRAAVKPEQPLDGVLF